MSWQALVPSLGLVPVSLTPMLMGGAGLFYSVVAFILSSGYLYYGARLAFRKSNVAARQLLMASIIYLPLVFFLIVLNRG
jgi:protoheme IX farnesyltransferase